jgi:hypothetical protein
MVVFLAKRKGGGEGVVIWWCGRFITFFCYY